MHKVAKPLKIKKEPDGSLCVSRDGGLTWSWAVSQVPSSDFGSICDIDPTGICDAVEDVATSVMDEVANTVTVAFSKRGVFQQFGELIVAIAKDKATMFIIKTALDILTAGFTSVTLDVVNSVNEVIKKIPVPDWLISLTKDTVTANLFQGGPGTAVYNWAYQYCDGVLTRMKKLSAKYINQEEIIQQGTMFATNQLFGEIAGRLGMSQTALFMKLKDYDPSKKWIYDGVIIDAYAKAQAALNALPWINLPPKDLAIYLNLSRIDCALEAKALATGRREDLDKWTYYINTDYTYGGVHYFYNPETGAVEQNPSEEEVKAAQRAWEMAAMSAPAALPGVGPGSGAIVALPGERVTSPSRSVMSKVGTASLTKGAIDNSGITKPSPAIAAGGAVVGTGVAMAAGLGLTVALPIGLAAGGLLWFLQER